MTHNYPTWIAHQTNRQHEGKIAALGLGKQTGGQTASDYFTSRPVPVAPGDLSEHNCINLRLPTNGTFYARDFEKHAKEIRVRVEGQLAFNASTQIFNAALDGAGLAYVPEAAMAARYVADGRPVSVLEDWSPTFSGYHLYYPTRRQSSIAFLACLLTLYGTETGGDFSVNACPIHESCSWCLSIETG